MKNLTIEKKLQLLYELQTIDSKIDELRTLAGELPFEVRVMEDEIEGLKTRLTNIEQQTKDAQTTISDFKVKINNAQATIERYKEQQNDVRNNREYENLSKEIEYHTLDIELSNKRINEAQNLLENLKTNKEQTKQQIEDRSADLKQKKTELDTILAETKDQTEKLTLASKSIEEKLEDERLVNAFKRIRKNSHNGLAVVKIERDSCGGCHNRVPAQRQIDIHKHNKIIVCEFCGRILVDDSIDAKAK